MKLSVLALFLLSTLWTMGHDTIIGKEVYYYDNWPNFQFRKGTIVGISGNKVEIKRSKHEENVFKKRRKVSIALDEDKCLKGICVGEEYSLFDSRYNDDGEIVVVMTIFENGIIEVGNPPYVHAFATADQLLNIND